uniref:NADP-dependent oxidoreductase domain-containing protein n=1 Tax=Aplanochytrium stocchinoi TaxID=215587 RepID=A0A6S8DF61_9STRA
MKLKYRTWTWTWTWILLIFSSFHIVQFLFVFAFDDHANANANMSTSMNSCTTLGRKLKMPAIGLGTYLLSNVSDAITSALATPAGYRRIDCAPVYFNEDVIGDALQKHLESNTSSLKREDLFITSKLASPFHRAEHVEVALRKTLTDLRG